MSPQSHQSHQARDRPTPEAFGIHWFRRDLRVVGNPALQANRTRMKGRTLGIFCFDRSFLDRPDYSVHRFAFFLKTLDALRKELRTQGGDLWVLDETPETAFRKLTSEFANLGKKPALWSYNRDYEPFARARDARVDQLIMAEGIELVTDRDHLLIEPDELRKPKGTDSDYYQIYTPFSKRWYELFQSTEVQRRVAEQTDASRKTGAAYFRLKWQDILPSETIEARERLDAYLANILSLTSISLPVAGAAAAFDQLVKFTNVRLSSYSRDRDYPALPGTSQLSIYLKNGSLTSAQIIAHLGKALALADPQSPGRAVPTQYFKELIWREFYYHILFHRPDVEHHAFQARYQKIRWENNPAYFEAWKSGKTGFPIVDAGMRQLLATGWMHNRVRMIVASFLTKDLLISWQWGEKYFMEKLLDGDLAPNNGGWQWAASTGCDAQPYFRVFNPKLQSERFDPEGEYIRRWIPELAGVKGKQIHEPGSVNGYPNPIVEHSEQKARAIALFKEANSRL